jgi:branched-chain amino acid transport system ATP-binding protein
MLKVRDLEAHYGDIKALDGISLEVGNREIVGIVGANGAGKSTMLSTLSGLVASRTGIIEFDGNDITRLPAHKIVELGLIHIPEARRLFPFMTVEENLDMGAFNSAARARKAAQLEFVYQLLPRLEERRHQIASTLSGGEQQMCAIARGLMGCPRFLLMDEPTLGLAPLLSNEIFALILSIREEGIPILVVEQQVVKTLEVADRAYVMENGSIVMSGTGDALLKDDGLRKAYLGI